MTYHEACNRTAEPNEGRKGMSNSKSLQQKPPKSITLAKIEEWDAEKNQLKRRWSCLYIGSEERELQGPTELNTSGDGAAENKSD
jgi:hypothetical protein